MDQQILLPALTMLQGKSINSFHASSNFYLLLLTFANILDPDQDQSGPTLVLIWIQTILHYYNLPERIF